MSYGIANLGNQACESAYVLAEISQDYLLFQTKLQFTIKVASFWAEISQDHLFFQIKLHLTITLYFLAEIS